MVYLKVSEDSEQAKSFLDFVKTMPFIEIIGEENIPNDISLKSFREFEKGEVTKAGNVAELMEKLSE
jgi:hypothetical protein